jgi:hypothetical protein
MWLYIPQSRSALESVDLTTELTEQSAERFATSLWWKGKRLAQATWRRKWKATSWLKRLSGLTLEPLQAQNATLTFADRFAEEVSTSSLAESPANPGPSLASRLEQTMNATYGRQVLKQLAITNRGLFLSRMFRGSQASLLGSDESPQILPEWVTQLQAVSLRRQKSAEAISANGALLWAIARATDTNNPGEHGQGGQDLRTQVENWMTPRAMDGQGSTWMSGPKGIQVPTHSGQAQMWTTVTASEAGGTFESRKKAKQKTGREQVTILNVVAADGWPTPTARDCKGGVTDEALIRADGKSRMDALPQMVERFPFARGEATTGLGQLLREIIPIYCPHYHLSQWSKSLEEMSESELQEVWESRPKNDRYRMRLNWKFSAWLMNIPIEHIACGLSETPSISKSQSTHS